MKAVDCLLEGCSCLPLQDAGGDGEAVRRETSVAIHEGTIVEVGARTRKNTAPRKPTRGCFTRAQIVAARSPRMTIPPGTYSPESVTFPKP